jgi:cysteine-S-conjugate beta-lyase
MSDRPLRTLTLDDLRRRTSIKWRLYPEDVLPLWVAEMDVPLAPAVVRAVREAMELGDTGYTTGTPYVEALQGFARDRWGWSFEAEQAVVVPDVMLGVVEMLKLVTTPGGPVVVNSPVYPPFYGFLRAAGRRVVEAPLEEDLRLDLSGLEAVFRGLDGPAAYLLCNPHNPTGTVHTRDELAAVAQLSRRYGVRVISDEIHAPLVYEGHRHTPYLTVTEDAFALLSASKAWNLAGLKAAVAVAGSEAVEDLRRMPEVATHGASHVGEIAHAAALNDGRGWLDALLVDLDENRRLLADLLAEHLPQIGYRMPEGTYLAWLDCRALGLGDDPAAVWLEKARVALNAGPEFGTGGAGHARLNLATTPEILTEAVRRLAADSPLSGRASHR